VQALKGKLADRLELGHALDRSVHLAVDQDLAALGLVAQARGKVRDRQSPNTESAARSRRTQPSVA
jgi:hypothetical protein